MAKYLQYPLFQGLLTRWTKWKLNSNNNNTDIHIDFPVLADIDS